MANTSNRLVLSGVTLPPLKINGLTITREKIWSENTGRTTSGNMVGDIIGIKTKLQCEMPPLTPQQVAQIDALLSVAFFPVTFTDPATNSRQTKTFYAGTPTYPVYTYVDGIKTYVGVKFDLIEQ